MATLPDADDAFDANKQDAVAEAISQLTPDEAAVFLFQLEMKLRKRKIMLTGYLVAMGLWLAAMLCALVIYGSATEGFVGWVFLLPFAIVGVTLWAFGKWAEKVGNTPPPPDLVEKVKRKQK